MLGGRLLLRLHCDDGIIKRGSIYHRGKLEGERARGKKDDESAFFFDIYIFAETKCEKRSFWGLGFQKRTIMLYSGLEVEEENNMRRQVILLLKKSMFTTYA